MSSPKSNCTHMKINLTSLDLNHSKTSKLIMHGKCCSIADSFLKFQLVHPSKQVANQLVLKKYLRVMDQRMSVKIFTVNSGSMIHEENLGIAPNNCWTEGGRLAYLQTCLWDKKYQSIDRLRSVVRASVLSHGCAAVACSDPGLEPHQCLFANMWI